MSAFRAHMGPVRSVEFSNDGQKLLTASNDKTVKLWTTAKHRFLFSLTDHTNWVKSAKFSPDGKLIGSCSDDKTIRIYDSHNQTPVADFLEKCSVNHIAFHPGNSNFAVALHDGTTKIYDVKMKKCVQCYPTLDGKDINSVDFHPNGKFLLTAGSNSDVNIIDIMESVVIFTLQGHQGAVNTVKFFDDGHQFATGGADKLILTWKSNFDLELPEDMLKQRVDSPSHVDASFMIARAENNPVSKKRKNYTF